MPDQTLHTLDLERAYRLHEIYRHYFPLPEVTLYHVPEWNDTLQQWVVSVRSQTATAVGVYIPCDYLTPDPTPCYRITESNPVEKREWIVQGIPPEARHLADELTKPDFVWLGIQRGQNRLSIERL